MVSAEKLIIDRQLAEAALNLMLEAAVPGKISYPIVQNFQHLVPLNESTEIKTLKENLENYEKKIKSQEAELLELKVLVEGLKKPQLEEAKE